MYNWVPPLVQNDKVIMGGLAMLPIARYGKLCLVFRSTEYVVSTLINVAHVPGLGLNLFSPRAAGKQPAVVIDPVGVHVTPGRSVFPSNDVRSQLPATRKVYQ